MHRVNVANRIHWPETRKIASERFLPNWRETRRDVARVRSMPGFDLFATRVQFRVALGSSGRLHKFDRRGASYARREIPESCIIPATLGFVILLFNQLADGF